MEILLTIGIALFVTLLAAWWSYRKRDSLQVRRQPWLESRDMQQQS